MLMCRVLLVPYFKVVGVAEQVGLDLPGAFKLEQPKVAILDVPQ